jgi:hypothetical protein
MSTDTFKMLLRKSFKFHALSKESKKFARKMKKLLKLELNMKILERLKELLKRQLYYRNSRKLLEISITLKKFSKLLTELFMFQLR